ncbi:MAG: TatD family hydrolase [Rhodospirillales bacterium]|nr:TatD family hydrolase [Alphaproteobacteria bacterium]MCB9977927.1 TatD family hydrolase [Rhodospirillales bacterium]
MWIDSHCHLNHERVAPEDTPSMLASRAQEAGVGGMISICCRITEEFDGLLEMVRPLPNVWCSIGTHPHDAGLADEKAISLELLCKKALSDPKIVGIGESGLDYFYDNSPRPDQQDSFRKHIRACAQTGLPLIVHSRDAEADTAQILREEGAGGRVRGVMHCFSSGPQLARDALDLGFYISFSGIVTFPKADELREIAKTVPLDRILVETDAPFLAPVPYRGKTNEPAFVAQTGNFLADFLGIDREEFAVLTTRNFFTLFDRARLA